MAAKTRYHSSSSFLQIFLALLWGSWLGFSPTFFTLQFAILILSLSFLRLPWTWLISSFLISWSLAVVVLDPLIDRIGIFSLRLPDLQHFWTEMAKAPVPPWTSFHNSMVLGSFLLGLLTIPFWGYVAWNLRHRAPLR